MNITISSINFHPKFKARKKEIRKADDIQRRMLQTFPMLSPSYMDEFYFSTKLDNEGNPVNKKARQFFKKADKKLTVVRDVSKNPEKYGIQQSKVEQDIPYTQLLDGIKLMKVGNCEEKATAMLAALCANRHYDAERVYLCLKTEYIDKVTGERKYLAIDSLDHAFIVTNFDKTKNEKDIVMDPWLGFTDSISGAKAKYKQIYDEKTMHKILSYHRSMFRLQMAEKTGKLINPDDYELRKNFVFYPAPQLSAESLEDLGLYSRIMFKNLIMPNNKD